MSGAEGAAARFGREFAAARWVARPGGFSGAAVFAGFTPGETDPTYCLKAHPPGAVTPGRLVRIHGWVGRAAHLSFVPRVYTTSDGLSRVETGGRLWELTGWMPGTADFRAHPSAARVENACRALAALHAAWRPAAPAAVPFPGVGRRLALLGEWRARDPVPFTPSPGLAAAVAAARAGLPRWAARAANDLAPWADRPVPVHPCLCDVHHDNVLFAPGGDEVTGVVDYAAMKPDHPAVDLARLLGDLVPDDPAGYAAGLSAYRTAGGSPGVTDELVRLLDRTGAVCAAANWLLRLTGPGRYDADAVAARLWTFVRRLEEGDGGERR